MPPSQYVTRDYLDERIAELQQHVVGRIDKLEEHLVDDYRRDIDRIEKKSNRQDIGVLIGSIIAAVLGFLGMNS